MEEILKYFPNLNEKQRYQFSAFEPLYREWNAKINVISRKDMDSLYLHHVLHSLSIAKVVDFPAGSDILDVGTGGGFPGLPLAVLYPNCRFVLCDSIRKKITVAQAVAEELCLDNVEFFNGRVEELKERCNYVVSRAVTDLATFYPWVRGKFSNAIVYLKGGDLDAEISEMSRRCRVSPEKICQFNISGIFDEEYFAEKKIVVITA